MDENVICDEYEIPQWIFFTVSSKGTEIGKGVGLDGFIVG